MKIDTWRCDICQAQKKDANRWWKVYMVAGGALIVQWESPEPDIRQPKATSSAGHLCGANCVTEWLSKNLL